MIFRNLAIASTVFAQMPAFAQPATDTAKYQPAISRTTACVRANAPPAHIEGVRQLDAFYAYMQSRCYPKFAAALAALGAPDAAEGGFRLIVRDEWQKFQIHLMTGR
jgi:hypothetical protein